MNKPYCACVLVLVIAGLAATPLRAQQPDERSVMQAINADRAERGLGPLQWDSALAQAAEEHAQWMAKSPALSHQYPGEPDLATRTAQHGAHFRVIAENVAMGPSPLGLEQQWMNSAPHRANILDPRLNAIGVGLVKRGQYYYGVADFSDAVAALVPKQIEERVDALLKQRGIEPSGPVRDARQTCEMPHGTAGGSSPRFVMRWEGSDLSQLPSVLEQQIKTGRYHRAAVGACGSGDPTQGFTTYRVAVMLY